jgi:hypothetical protein
VRRSSNTAIGGPYATRRMALTPGVVYTTTGVYLAALKEHIHSDGAILRGRKYFLLMLYIVLTMLLSEMLDVARNGPHGDKLRLLCQGW